MRSEALKSIQQALHPGDGAQAGLFIIAVCSALMLLVLLKVLAAQWKRRRQLVEGWRRFSEGMARHALTAAQRALMVEMARREAPDDPASLLQSPEIFERAVHHHLRPLAAGGAQAALERAAVLIRGVRQATGFSEARGPDTTARANSSRGSRWRSTARPMPARP